MGGLVVQAFKLSLRSLWRRKGFAAIVLSVTMVVIAGLTLGAAWIDAITRPSDVQPRLDRTLLLDRIDRESGRGALAVTAARLAILADSLPGVEASSWLVPLSWVWGTVGGRDIEVPVTAVDDGYWQMFSPRPLAGRGFTRSGASASREAVLTRGAAEILFPDGPAVGRRFPVDGGDAVVVGVVERPPPWFAGGLPRAQGGHHVWVSSLPRDRQSDRSVMLRLLAKSTADVPAIQAEVRRRFLATAAAFRTRDLTTGPLPWDATPRTQGGAALVEIGRELRLPAPAFAMIVASLLFVLVLMAIPAFGLAAITEGRLEARRSEIGVRRTFGARAGRVVLQLLVENVVITALGAALALALVWGVTRSEGLFSIDGQPMRLFGAPRAALVWYALAFAVVFGVLSGLVPAWRVARLDPISALRGRP